MVVILFSQFRSFFCVIIFRIFSQVNLFAKGRRQKFDTLSLKIFKYKIEMFELRFKMHETSRFSSPGDNIEHKNIVR